jgi:hypothetical protein
MNLANWSEIFTGFRKPVVVGPTPTMLVGPTPVIVVAPPPAILVETPHRAAWDERGWNQEAHGRMRVYRGQYQVYDRRLGRLRRFAGRVVVDRKEVCIYIADPPAEIKRHPKGPCFALEETPWFRLHWHHPARHVDEAILYMEKVLAECLN